MPIDQRDLELQIKRALADPDYREQPLYELLQQLWQLHKDQITRLERIIDLSDAYQSVARERETSLTEQFEKQLRQLSKIVRISDRYQLMMRDLNVALKEASTHDLLTGLGNRRLVMERLKEEAERASRSNEPFVLAMMDVDHFKRVNDSLGHDTGDRVLIEIARTIDAELREYDVCGRWGGEEFLILLPQTRMVDAMKVVARVHAGIGDLAIRTGDEAISVSCSIGVAEYRQHETFSDTLNRADAALLEAKRQGRNRYLSA